MRGVLLALFISGCACPVTRAELAFLEVTNLGTAASLKARLRQECCQTGSLSDLGYCQRDARQVVLVEARVSWHFAMTRYNLGMDSKPPKRVPEVPKAASVCYL